MLYQKQKYLHDPENGVYGDCYRTCIANLLDLPRDSVPNWIGIHWGSSYDDWNNAVMDFLKSHNLSKVTIVRECALFYLLEEQGLLNPNAYYMLNGSSSNNTEHVVICCGGNIIFDPSLDDSGIMAPCSDGCYYIEYLIPLSIVKEDSKEVQLNSQNVTVLTPSDKVTISVDPSQGIELIGDTIHVKGDLTVNLPKAEYSKITRSLPEEDQEFIGYIRRFLVSGNDVPVEKVWLKASDIEGIISIIEKLQMV